MSLTHTAYPHTVDITKKPLPAIPRHSTTSFAAVPSTGRNTTLSANLARKIHSVLGHRDAWADIPTTNITTPQAEALVYLLSLPLSTPLLTTKVAWLGAPLSRHGSSLWPKDLCETHTWFEPKYLHQLTQLIGKELWDRSEGLYAFTEERLGEEVRVMLYETLWPYREIFPRPEEGVERKGPERIGSPYEAFSKPNCSQESCTACKLSLFFEDRKAVRALALLCKGRKQHRYTWPELLAFLEPVEKGRDPNWRRRWVREGKDVRRERRRVRHWRERGGKISLAAKGDEGEECPIVWSPTEDAKFEEQVRLQGRCGKDSWGYSDCVVRPGDDLEDESVEYNVRGDDDCSTLLPMKEEDGIMDGREKAWLALYDIGVVRDTSDVDQWFPHLAQVFAQNRRR